MFVLTTERPEDGPAIEALLDLTFGPQRRQKTSYRYRTGVARVPELSMVARDRNDKVVGTIRYWPIAIGAQFQPALLLGPIAVDPAWQKQGVGAALMRHTLDMAAWAGHQIVLLVGDETYYRRFGFRPASAYGIVMANEQPQRLLALALKPGALADLSGLVQPWRWVRRAAALADARARGRVNGPAAIKTTAPARRRAA